jgi:hypothetical protein
LSFQGGFPECLNVVPYACITVNTENVLKPGTTMIRGHHLRPKDLAQEGPPSTEGLGEKRLQITPQQRSSWKEKLAKVGDHGMQSTHLLIEIHEIEHKQTNGHLDIEKGSFFARAVGEILKGS